MADAIHKTTARIRRSIDAAELEANEPGVWLFRGAKGTAWSRAELDAIANVDPKFWKIAGDKLAEMNTSEKKAVTDAEAAKAVKEQEREDDLDAIREDFTVARDKIQQVLDGTATNLAQVNAAMDLQAGVSLQMLKAQWRQLNDGQ